MINRRHFSKALAGTALLARQPLNAQEIATTPRKFEATWDSLKLHRVPEWYNNAKLGIFIHWGLYSVPAWAPPPAS
jgi:alpha-L-fucosidase